MNLNSDDPRLTAYALGEMPEKERAAFEAELQRSPECRAIAEEIRQAATLLETNLATEEMPVLSFAQQRKVENRLMLSRERPRSLVWKIFFYGGLSAATVCLLAVLFLPALSKSKSRAMRLTANSQSQSQLNSPHSSGRATPSVRETEINNLIIAPPLLNDNLGDKTATAKNSVTSSGTSYAPGQLSLRAPGVNSRSSGGAVELNYGVTTGPINGRESAQPARPAPAVVTLEGLTTTTGKRASIAGGATGGGRGGGEFSGNATPLPLPDPQPYSRRGEDGKEKSQADTGLYSAEVVGYVDAPSAAEASDRIPRFRGEIQNTASYPHLVENGFLSVRNQPLSTFSIDVDTASYANVRRFLKEGRMPPRDAVRIEELINYFSYKYPQPHGNDPFAASIEVAGCPWNAEHRLVRIGLKGREIAQDKRPPSNFVFLIDVSGSMQPPERLPLIKQALRQLVKKMNERDRVAIVVYASEAGLKLESTSCAEKEKILQAIDELGAGGSTNGGDGIRQAYRVAEEYFIKEGVNRVLLCTDGDFNVGMTDQNELVRMIQQKAKSGVFLTTLGVGTDNYKDALMQKLADKGNGNYHYLDTLEEAQKVLIDQMNGTLVTIAKDVKIQVEFNPAQVGAYRLIGYEKRMLRKEDFNNDAKDAGEIGAGHTVTALYEIVPAGGEIPSAVDELKYQQPLEQKPERYTTTGSRELLTLKLRYKQPDGDRSRLLEFPVADSGKRFSNASTDFKFAALVASFGMLLRDSEYKGNASYGAVLEWAAEAKGPDEAGYRAEFLNLVRKAQSLR